MLKKGKNNGRFEFQKLVGREIGTRHDIDMYQIDDFGVRYRNPPTDRERELLTEDEDEWIQKAIDNANLDFPFTKGELDEWLSKQNEGFSFDDLFKDESDEKMSEDAEADKELVHGVDISHLGKKRKSQVREIAKACKEERIDPRNMQYDAYRNDKQKIRDFCMKNTTCFRSIKSFEHAYDRARELGVISGCPKNLEI